MARKSLFRSGSERGIGAGLKGVLQGYLTHRELKAQDDALALKRQAEDREGRTTRLLSELKLLEMGRPSSLYDPLSGQTTTIPGVQDVSVGEDLSLQKGPGFSLGPKAPQILRPRPTSSFNSEAEKSVDRKFGQEYANYVAGGGSAEAQRRISQLESVANGLESGAIKTGVVSGIMAKLPFTGSRAAQENVASVVQTNLRQILGGQFSEREGQQLIERAFNPSQPPQENAARLKNLLVQLKDAARAKEEAARYYEKFGTLKGYTGKIYTSVNDFNPQPTGNQIGRFIVEPQ